MVSNNLKYYAHSREGRPVGEWQVLEEHLKNVAEMAGEFAKPFGGEEWAWLAGLWHDLGKYSNEFQKKLYDANGVECHLETKPGNVIHSQAGGHLAQQIMAGGVERIFCWLIMGHHAGLADFSSDKTGAKALGPKMAKSTESAECLANVPDAIKNQQEPLPPALLTTSGERADISFFIRILFSCVVDADFLDTEAFMDRNKKRLRDTRYPTLKKLLTAFNAYIDDLCESAKSNYTEVNKVRAEVLEQCRKAANGEPGVYSLTVPTGGGKTLSSLAFALKHAVKHGKKRVIYVIPYTSIIEQTAEVFRKIPGLENTVIEHHCNVMAEDETKESARSRLAAENWDAPLIVTTSVQFFESLYGCKTSRCRKLHNIANSVVIFDEAQCLPPAFLRPVVYAIRELNRHYGVTPVLCTATQPVLDKTESFDFKFNEGFDTVTEIIDKPGILSQRLSRVEVEIYNDLLPTSLEDLSKMLYAEGKSLLCIVNRKDDARELSRMLHEDSCVHLSTNMCAAHRLKVLADIKARLEPGRKPFIVISTSLVEAGVDLDFPIVYRAIAGLDSIAQAAGRCNREGNLDKGRTVVFMPEKQPDYVQGAASLANGFLTDKNLPAVFLPDTFSSYFNQYFYLLGGDALDKKGIRELLPQNLNNIYFRTAANKFRLIDDSWQLPLIVPYGDAIALVGNIRDWNARMLFRKLQRYTISVPKQILWQLLERGHAAAMENYPDSYILQDHGLYSERYGFVPPDKIDAYEPTTLVV